MSYNQDYSYDGWSNRETWAVKLWIDNDEGWSNYWLGAAQTAGNTQQGKDLLAEWLLNNYQAGMPDMPGVYADLLQTALIAVNWYEIAESLLEAVADPDAEAV